MYDRICEPPVAFVYPFYLHISGLSLVMLGVAGSMALALGVVGLYGVIAYVVTQRSREIGIRLALGAQRREVRRMFVRQGLALSALGVLFREGELTIGALAAHERVQPPSMTRTVNCLVEEGYVARRANDADGRQVLIDLTDKGREILLADRRRRDVWLARRLRELTPDERDLLRRAAPILQRLATTD